MIKARLQEILIHPLSISFFLWLVIILFIPPLFSKYRIKHTRDEFTSLKTGYIFHDFDNDSKSEMLEVDLNDPFQTKLIVSLDNRVIDQFNLKYQPTGPVNVYLNDYDGDGYSECYIFTANSDSVFLNIIDPLKSQSVICNGRFIDFRRHAPQSTDTPQIVPVGMIETNRGKSDFVFYITTGFSRQPRNVYRYLIDSDSLVRSPVSGAGILDLKISDIDSEAFPEFILSTASIGNTEEDFPYSDEFAWLMVLDHNLEFEFPPVRFMKYPSRLMVIPFKSGNFTRMVLFHDYFGTEDIKSAFYIFDSEGNKITEKELDDYDRLNCNLFINQDEKKKTFYFMKNQNTEIEELDSNLNVINTTIIPAIEVNKPLAFFDADLDGNKEYMFQGSGNRSLVITQDDFRDPVQFRYSEPGEPVISSLLSHDKKPAIYLQFDGYGSYISFFRNPFYYLKYPFYVALYLGVLAFISLLFYIQRYRLNLIQQTERKIAGLQMKAIKNQIEPHFTLNMLNAIGSLYANEVDKAKADYLFAKYARLVRQTVINSDKIIVTLTEELEFVRNYIDLERFRCDNSFGYIINIDESIDMKTEIPRMLIHTFVENSVKHGVRNRPKDGLLRITIEKDANNYQIKIEDNGPGLGTDDTSVSGTGQGLHIVNELIDLYSKLKKSRITYSLENIPGPENSVGGAIAIIDLLL